MTSRVSVEIGGLLGSGASASASAAVLPGKGIHNLHIRSESGFTCLHRACRHGFTSLVQELVTRGADVHATGGGVGNNGNNGNVGNVGGVETTPSSISMTTAEGGSSKKVHDKGDKGDKDDKEGPLHRWLGRTPLHEACARVGKASVDICMFLVDVGKADICAVDNGGNSCIHIAAAHNNIPLLLHLLSMKRQQINISKKSEKADKLDKLDTHGRNCNEHTPLHIACQLGHIGAAVALLEAGCHPDMKDSRVRAVYMGDGGARKRLEG